MTRARRPALNPRQQRFVEEYLIDLNATKAATRAGYSPRTAQQIGSRLLLNVVLQEALAKRQVVVAERAALSVEWVVGRLRENLERALQAEPVRDGEGQPTGEYIYQGSVANKALELLGRHLGMWKEGTVNGKRVMRFVFVDEGGLKGVEVIDGE
jgi:phage terminase small subunit